MHKYLFFLCPTDGLEPVINEFFEQENYFYTSLGNSFALNYKDILTIIEKNSIEKIFFILANDNQVFKDALGQQYLSDISGLDKCYKAIVLEKENTRLFWNNSYKEFTILSYYLNKKISELQHSLNQMASQPVKFIGKIYDRKLDAFQEIHSHLICLQKDSLN
ncbi:hypothetical protein KH5_10670 [Urechidicola sp. KH5]